MKIETILTTKGSTVTTVQAKQPVKAAIDLLVGHNIGALVVTDEEGKPVGIISERDVVRAAARGEDFAQPISQVMTKRVIVGSPQDDLASVMRTMTEKRFRHLPIMDRGKLVGIVSIGDMVKAQLDEYQGEIDTLETQILES
ncbi:MAG: CBS domain-containing protein [Anaerolineales bacterium]